MNQTIRPLDQSKQLLQEMWWIRAMELEIATRYADQDMRCPVHLCTGQEATAVGICQALNPTDNVYSNHRAHGHYLAKGGDPVAFIAELYGLANGCLGGRGGSMHLCDMNVHFMASTPIVGGIVPVAMGAAFAQQYQLNPGQDLPITVVFLGDGCFEEGVVHESLNFAALHQLPLLFALENNQYSVYTQLKDRQPDRPLYQLAQAHGVPSQQIDGNDVWQVLETAQTAVAHIRAGKGPQLIEMLTYRWPEHCGPNDDDHLGYRPLGELATWQAKCPIRLLTQQLRAQGVNDDELTQIKSVAFARVCHVFDQALASPIPNVATRGDFVYAG